MMRTVKHEGTNDHIIIMLHGTGGSADSLFNIGQYVDEHATLIGIEGEVMENGMRRYFERYPDGTFKLKSLAEATHKLYGAIKTIVNDNPSKTITIIGYSNGANIALNVLKEHADLNVDYAILYHPSPVRTDVAYQKQNKIKVLLTSGSNDSFISEEQFEQLYKDVALAMRVNTYSHTLGHELIQEELDVTRQFLRGLYE